MTKVFLWLQTKFLRRQNVPQIITSGIVSEICSLAHGVVIMCFGRQKGPRFATDRKKNYKKRTTAGIPHWSPT